MTCLAFGAKCGSPGRPGTPVGFVPPNSLGFSSEASAMPPSPPDAPKKCRRVISVTSFCFTNGSRSHNVTSLLTNRFVQAQDDLRHGSPRRQHGFVEPRIDLRLADMQQFRGGGGMLAIMHQLSRCKRL